MSIRIVIGSEPRTEIARKVLEYSILNNTKYNIDFYQTKNNNFTDRGDLGEGTGFSLFRFDIPERFNFHGRAIYLDSDMLCLEDISKLWKFGNTEQAVYCKLGNETRLEAETSMMVINCEKSKNKIKTLSEIKKYLVDDVERKKYREIMKLKYLQPQPTEISRWWNIMDKNCILSKIQDFENPKAKILHYSNVRIQPWFYPKHPYSHIWSKWFLKAFKDGYLSKLEIEEANQKYNMDNPKRPDGLHSFWLEKIKC